MYSMCWLHVSSAQSAIVNINTMQQTQIQCLHSNWYINFDQNSRHKLRWLQL